MKSAVAVAGLLLNFGAMHRDSNIFDEVVQVTERVKLCILLELQCVAFLLRKKRPGVYERKLNKPVLVIRMFLHV